MESQHDDDDPMLYTNSPSGSQHSPPRPPSPRSSPGLTSTASPPGSTSTASSKYLIEETTTNQHYEEDIFLQRKFLDVAQSYRIVPKAASSSYLDEFKRLSVFLSSRISSYLETHRATKVC